MVALLIMMTKPLSAVRTNNQALNACVLQNVTHTVLIILYYNNSYLQFSETVACSCMDIYVHALMYNNNYVILYCSTIWLPGYTYVYYMFCLHSIYTYNIGINYGLLCVAIAMMHCMWGCTISVNDII